MLIGDLSGLVYELWLTSLAIFKAAQRARVTAGRRRLDLLVLLARDRYVISSSATSNHSLILSHQKRHVLSFVS